MERAVMKPEVAGRNLTQQKGLPRLPASPLQQTCELYLSSLEPILEVDEMKRAKELVAEFQQAGGVVEKLQTTLESRADNMENWLTDAWIKHLFLDDRKPMVIHSSFGILFPQMDFSDKQGQIRCAAELIAAALHVKTMIDNETLPAEYMRGKPLCLKQYEQAISSCRIPGLETDTIEFYSKSSNPPKHITVVHNCQFFALDVYNSDGTPLTVDQLCVQLERICNSSLQTNMEPVGILTTERRDSWSKTYTNLTKDETNKESVSAIQRSIFTVCLHKAMPPVSDEMYRSSAFCQILHGGGSQWNSGNVWFDKGLQFIIGENGTCGAIISHAGADGTVGMALSDYVVSYMKKPRVMKSPMEPLPMPQRLDFNITPEIKKDIEEAKQHIDTLVQALNVRTAIFDHFGKNLIKALKMSPDAFLQMAIQLAYYRTYQKVCSTLEPASLRTFNLGRLAGICSCSPASATFVKAFDDPTKQNSEKFDLLEKAIKTHVLNTNTTLGGLSLEAHLLFLLKMAMAGNMSVPDLFTDISFAKAFDYEITTSQVTSKTGCVTVVGPHKKGILMVTYGIMDEHIDLAMSTFEASNTCKENKAANMIRALEDALLDMRTVLEQTSRAEF